MYIYLAGFFCLAVSPAQAMQVCGTPQGFGADSLDCLQEDLLKPQQIAKVRLWRARRHTFEHPVLIDSLGATAGIQVCFTQPDSIQATYWIQPVNEVGIGACLGDGISWPNTVGVSYPAEPAGDSGERWFDSLGRRLPHKPDTPGVYWLRKKGHKTRKIVVMVQR